MLGCGPLDLQRERERERERHPEVDGVDTTTESLTWAELNLLLQPRH